MRSTLRHLFLALSLACLCNAVLLMTCFSIANAQTSAGQISGTVKDASGAILPGVSVTVTNEATTLTRTVTTDDSGFYVITNLPVGNYSVTSEQRGFRRITKTGIELVADGRLTVDFALEPGEVTGTVEVTAAGETVNTTSGEVARVVDSQQVQNLALNGRNYMQLVSLIPGAALLDDNQLDLTTSLSISSQAINGNRTNTNNLTVDGGFNMDSGSNNSQINNVGGDFIQEVKIQTSNFSAEYGRNSGAAINVVTRSGGNQFHGNAFEYIRNNALDARNFFAPVKGKLRFNNFGWDFSGPIKKDKLFFFGGQEYKYIRRDTDPSRQTLPTRAERQGDFSGRGGTLNLPGTTRPVPGRNISWMMTANFRTLPVNFGGLSSSPNRCGAPGNAVPGPSNCDFGTITTAGPSRNIQFGLKLDF